MDQLQQVKDDIATIVLGKDLQIKQTLCCLLARGHLLLEDVPGVGKTTLAQAFAKVVGLAFRRLQFTSDLMPADVLGVSVFDRSAGEFVFHPGAIFTEFLLVDEINRASPKTQSALLEAMAERQVTVEGETRSLAPTFFVMATQNPWFQSGTFPLPESQLDRFLMRISLGYPDPAAERELLMGGDPRERLAKLSPVLNSEKIQRIQREVDQVVAREGVVSYVQRLVSYTRQDAACEFGLSTRASMALLQCARAWAYLHQRDYVLPDDVQAVLEPVVAHRLQQRQDASDSDGNIVARMLEQVPVV